MADLLHLYSCYCGSISATFISVSWYDLLLVLDSYFIYLALTWLLLFQKLRSFLSISIFVAYQKTYFFILMVPKEAAIAVKTRKGES